jgi:pimeloyl-ACP methyl ester carboxylesterase
VKRRPALLASGLAAFVLVASASSPAPAFQDSASTGAGLTAKARAFVIANLLGGHGAGASRATALRAAGNTAPAPCTPGAQVLCAEVDVPLDPTGVVPGTVPLHVEEVPALGTPRGAMFLIAGGPGQGSSGSFDLGSASSVALYQSLFPGYTLVAYDDRGTGKSGLLNCPPLQAASTSATENQQVASCAAALGPARDHYSTVDHVNDLEAVRVALGLQKIGLYGTSYGTKLALAYALAYPQNVERLLLDSVLPVQLPDPFAANVLAAMPATLTRFCSNGSCAGATRDYAGDVVAVANALAAKPVSGRVLQPNGSLKTVRLGGLDFLSMILDSDLNPGLAAELPAVVHAARLGNSLPMLRIYQLDSATSAESAADLSSALYAATDCHDGPFPWQPDTPIQDRPALVQAAIAALPAGSLGPFGAWAAGFGNASFCINWPSPAGGVVYGPGPYPDVPMLAVSGGYDMRTPTGGADSVAAQFPQGHVLVVPGVGHSVLGADGSGCSQRAVRNWMLGASVPASCPRPGAFVGVTPAYPAASTRPATAAQTLLTATKTIEDAESVWLMTAGLSGGSDVVAGVASGKLIESGRAITFVKYGIAAGVSLSGTVHLEKFGPPIRFQGTVTVGGRFAATGLLGVSGASVRGTLGGRVVGR